MIGIIQIRDTASDCIICVNKVAGNQSAVGNVINALVFVGRRDIGHLISVLRQKRRILALLQSVDCRYVIQSEKGGPPSDG